MVYKKVTKKQSKVTEITSNTKYFIEKAKSCNFFTLVKTNEEVGYQSLLESLGLKLNGYTKYRKRLIKQQLMKKLFEIKDNVSLLGSY